MSPEDLRAVRLGPDYEAQREAARAELEALKALRRIRLGDRLSLVFENTSTIRGALEETLRAERVADPTAAAADADAFAAIAPAPGQLAAVLFIDSDDPGALNDAAAELRGVERALFVEAGGRRVAAAPAEGTDPAAGAALVTFALDDADRHALRSSGEVAVAVEHEALRVRVVLENDQRQALLDGL